MYSYEFDRDRNNSVLIEDESRVGVKRHFHNCIEFIYVLKSGDTVAHIDGEVFPLSDGQICAVSCFSTHYYEQKRAGRYIVCLIPRRFFRELESIFNVNCFRVPILNDNEEGSLLHTFRMMQYLSLGKDIFGVDMPEDSETYIDAQLHRLCSYLISLFIQHCGLHERHRISSMVADAVRIIETDFKSDITTATISKKLGCYQKSLAYHFTKTMGMSILNYLERTRVLEAARLLGLNQQMTIEAVMLESGFRSSRSFLRHFKSVFGCTPTEYKKRQR